MRARAVSMSLAAAGPLAAYSASITSNSACVSDLLRFGRAAGFLSVLVAIELSLPYLTNFLNLIRCGSTAAALVVPHVVAEVPAITVG